MVLEIKEFGGGVSSFSDRGPRGSFKFASGIDIRKDVDTLSCGQALEEEGILGTSHSSSPSTSPSRSLFFLLKSLQPIVNKFFLYLKVFRLLH